MVEKRGETSRFSFTMARLNKLPSPTKGRVYHHDTKVAGLCLCVTAAGGKTYYLYKWTNGRPQRVRLGKFPDISVDVARKAASELTGEIAKGRDVAAERRARRESPTLADLFAHWWETHSKPHKRTWQDDQRMFDKYLAEHHGRRLDTITRADVQRWHSRIGEHHGRCQANRVRALLSAIYGVAIDLGHTGPNPCIGVKRYGEESRERFLQPSETRDFFEALADEKPLWRDFFLLLLFTGARRGNVARMRWDQIDLDRAVWYLPGREQKGGLATAVVLPEPAVIVLQARRKADPGGAWVFPSNRTKGSIEDPKNAWERIRRRSGLTDLRMHDLRRSLGSWQAALGTSLNIIGKSLGHRSLAATQIYARLQLDPVREAVNGAVDAMLTAGDAKLLTQEGQEDATQTQD